MHRPREGVFFVLFADRRGVPAAGAIDELLQIGLAGIRHTLPPSFEKSKGRAHISCQPLLPTRFGSTMTAQKPSPDLRSAVQETSPMPISTTPWPGAVPIVPSGR